MNNWLNYRGDSVKIFLAAEYGFCYGVKRAVQLAENAPPGSFTLGSLIHNPQLIAKLEDKGIRKLDNIEHVPEGSTVVIRSHGSAPDTYDKLQAKNCTIIDATCTNVKQAQKTAHAFRQEGRQVIIVGEANHPEVQSIAAWCEPNIIVETLQDAQNLNVQDTKYGVVCQTTLETEKFEDICRCLQGKIVELVIKPTICAATKNRQEAAVKLAKDVDAMLVIGGYSSANTRHLYDLVRNICQKTWHIETADDLTDKMLIGISSIGVTAGASTPNWLIDDIIEKIRTLTE